MLKADQLTAHSYATGDSKMGEYRIPDGMAISVFNDRYARMVNGRIQAFHDRAREMVRGNTMLDPNLDRAEIEKFIEYAVAGITPLSGRHLQHGDDSQNGRNIEVFTNCSTAAFSFIKFYLLLNGSGVGRDYSSESCRVDWENMPNVRLVLDGGIDDSGDTKKGAHPDYLSAMNEFNSCFDSVREAAHKYDAESEDVRWIKVRDSREGWAETIAILETAAFHRNHKDSLFIFDFSDVRGKGSPIKGMQNRPAQGPLPLMRAIARIMTVKGTKMKAWKQALFIDHYLAACVVMGNVRRAARMATKWWRDRDVIEFIDIKRGGFLWSANNSILVDNAFWEEARNPRPSHARRVFEAAVGAAYYDKTGEPGLINVDALNCNRDGFEKITSANYLNPKHGLKLHRKTYEMIDKTLDIIKASSFPFITNPCQPSWAPILTPDGIKRLEDVKVGDQIWGGSSWVRVAKKWSTGVKPVYRFRTSASVFYGTENHRIVQNGVKVPVAEASAIDVCAGEFNRSMPLLPNVTMDGLVIGDGSRHLTSKHKVYLDVGSPEQERDYLNSEVGALIIGPHPAKAHRARIVETTIMPDELPPLPERSIPDRFVYGSASVVAAFLRGLFAANGSCNGSRVTLKTASKMIVEQVQMMLSSLGIVSYFTTNKPKAIEWENGTYVSKESYDVNINCHNARRFQQLIGFIQPHKAAKLAELLEKPERSANYQKRTFDIASVEYISDEEVFDITVEHDEHVYWSGGCLVSNCGEIVLAKFGGYCVIGDVVLSKVKSTTVAETAVALTAKALIRANLMPALYQSEVDRTNRIGVGLTGIFEYAWSVFGLNFRDLISAYDHLFEGKQASSQVMKFWEHINHLRQIVEETATEYSTKLGRQIPHTFTTIKPSGTISKIMSCTEGAHLPPYLYYVRWVICEKGSDKQRDYERRGYPIKDVSHAYHNCVVVGFPTKHSIVDIIPEDQLVTASDVTPEEQFKWVRLIEEFWFGQSNHNNQVSYTLKYDNNAITHDRFSAIILEWQQRVRCCSVMPFTDESAYPYVPEQKVDRETYLEMLSKIKDVVKAEEYSDDELMCPGGACPIEQKLGV